MIRLLFQRLSPSGPNLYRGPFPAASGGAIGSQRIVRRVTRGGRRDTRLRRYIAAAVIGCAVSWIVALGYLKVSPPGYTSGFVLVLPGTGAGTSMNLDRIGQASTTSASAFASPELSPTENYRKMLLSHRLLVAAAAKTGEDADAFPTPRIDLADQTKLITVKIGGRSGEQAAARADAVRLAFMAMLDSLRSDEIETRDAAYQNMLAGYKVRLNGARQRVTEYEASTGLVSVDQYGTIVAGGGTLARPDARCRR